MRTCGASDDRGVSHLVLTHDHFDHILGSTVFAGALVHAMPAVAETMAHRTDYLREHALSYGAGAARYRPTVVSCGDLVEESGDPAVGPESDSAQWAVALDRVLTVGGPDAVYVPGHGAVVDAEFVRLQQQWLRRL
jgi:glyoxylase-like metal-dependent hydrolase (beta-lactamase superfamily II)